VSFAWSGSLRCETSNGRLMSSTPKSITNDLYFKATIATAVFAAIFGAGYLAGVHPPYDSLGYLVGRDFVNTWMGARAGVSGDAWRWFDLHSYNAALHDTFGPHFPEHNWSYPPHLLLFTWPLAFMPYLAALAFWSAVGFATYFWAAGQGELRADRQLMLVLAPAAIMNLFAGQTGFFAGALTICGLSQLDRRPVLSGVFFGLLTIKPQLGLLLPLMLILTARWRCFVSAAITTIVLIAASAAIFGPEIWTQYLTVAVPVQQAALTGGTGPYLMMMPTPFMNARIMVLPLQWAWIIQGIISAAAVAATIWTFQRRRDPVLSIALLVTASFLVTPYAFNYDMVAFSWVIALLRDHETSTLTDHRLAIAVWTLPVTVIALGLARLPLSSLILVAFAARLLWRLSNKIERPLPVSIGA